MVNNTLDHKYKMVRIHCLKYKQGDEYKVTII